MLHVDYDSLNIEKCRNVSMARGFSNPWSLSDVSIQINGEGINGKLDPLSSLENILTTSGGHKANVYIMKFSEPDDAAKYHEILKNESSEITINSHRDNTVIKVTDLCSLHESYLLFWNKADV